MTQLIISDESAADLETSASQDAEENSIFPVSFAQERLWLLDQLEPNSPLYNIPMPARLRGPLDEAILQKALNGIVQRHEPLRTTFKVVDVEPVQVISPGRSFKTPERDLSKLPEGKREIEALHLLEVDAKKPFNLADDLMVRTQLIRLSSTEHILGVNIHHIAADGWSIGIFYQELQALYDAFLRGEESPLPELTIQYADFGVWQRQWLQGPVLQKQLDYWRRQLAGAPALLELPLDKPRPAVQSYRGGRREFVLDRTLIRAFKELVNKESCTLFMGLLAVFKTLVLRYTGQTDIVVGSPIANRTRAETEGIIGCFSNTLVLRTNLSGTPNFREVLKRVRETTMDALVHQDLPFEKLVEALQPVRDPSYSPLFQLMFMLQNAPVSVSETGSLGLAPFEVVNGTTKFDVTLAVVEGSTGISGVVEYSSDLFKDETIERFVGHWQTLLKSIVATPEEPITRLTPLTPIEYQQLIVDWNATEKNYPRELTLPELVEAQAARTPEVTAVEFEGKRITYGELNRRANQLARHLRSLGVAPEVRVGICVERSLEMVIGLLAIVKAGGAYVPLDPKYPRERLTLIVTDAQLKVLLTQKSLLSEWSESKSGSPRLVCIDDVYFAKEDESNLNLKFGSESPAYMLYTSGSTGKPKGVLITHRAMVNFLFSMAEEPGLTAQDVCLAVTTLSFDIAGMELWLPLMVGARVLLVSAEVAIDGRHLAEQTSQATVMQATPGTWRLLIEAGWQGDPKLKLLCGGEAWPDELAAQLLSRCGSLWNMYGPTETTIYSAALQVRAGEPPLIGPPIANTQLYILDNNLQPVPMGVAGELHIGGDGLARGYWQREELTHEKFINNPFKPGGRLYKTGDLVRYRSGRRIEFLGRMDQQVKVRGYRIEPGEIESLLNQHPGVREAVVVVREDMNGGKRLVAYVVPKANGTCTVEILHQTLKEKLPEYMVPSAILLLPSLPLTPNGKIDRKAVPAPDSARAERAFVAPRDPLELQLTQLWEKIFGIEPIGIQDNFFELGGHSLLAVRLFAQVEKLTGKSLPLVTLFQSPTIEQLAVILRQQGWEPPWSSLVPIKPDGSKPPFYCVHGVGGNILEYMDLAKYMEADQPFYGLQAAGLNGKKPWHGSVEEMASYYIEEIQAFQPRGPYYIGGSSFGGLVAYEMALQLHDKGEQVALLAFFDTHAPGYPKFLPNMSAGRLKLNHFIHRVSLHWGNFKAASGRERASYVWVKAGRWQKSQVWRFKRMWRNSKQKVESWFWPKAIREAKKTGRQAACIYTPRGYTGKATLFRATGQMKGIYPDPTLGWGSLIQGGLEIYDTPGHHGAIVREPRAGQLAEQLKASLHKAQSAVQLSRMQTAILKLDAGRSNGWQAPAMVSVGLNGHETNGQKEVMHS
ncbi:MAG: amino acid adenylation domain protein [Pedosphaera sp.]|nr:amino acid adenylation domain protein [Pedosphaera sp.]